MWGNPKKPSGIEPKAACSRSNVRIRGAHQAAVSNLEHQTSLKLRHSHLSPGTYAPHHNLVSLLQPSHRWYVRFVESGDGREDGVSTEQV